MGLFEQGGPSTKTAYEAAGLIDPTSEAAILLYLQWQSVRIRHLGDAAARSVAAAATFLVADPIQHFSYVTDACRTFPAAITSAAELLPILYRICDETSVSQYYCDGFTAGAMSMPTDAFSVRNMVNLHGNWSSRDKLPFISITSTPDGVARQVAIRQDSRNQLYIMVALIDTTALLGLCQLGVWKMQDARDHFGLVQWNCHRRGFDHEYICALRIPARAVFPCCRPKYFSQNAFRYLHSLGWMGGVGMEMI